jgi:PAS domain-containing protein
MAGRTQTFGDADRPTIVCEDPDNVSDPVLGFFLDYWRRKHRGDAVPLVADFIPKEVRRNLRWVVLIDALPDYNDFRYRLVGSSVCEYFLGDGTGRTVRESFAGIGDLGEGIVALCRRACLLARPIQVTGPSDVVNDIFFPPYDSLYLPYATRGEKPDRLVNTFVFNYGAIREKRPYTITGMLTGPSTTP